MGQVRRLNSERQPGASSRPKFIEIWHLGLREKSGGSNAHDMQVYILGKASFPAALSFDLTDHPELNFFLLDVKIILLQKLAFKRIHQSLLNFSHTILELCRPSIVLGLLPSPYSTARAFLQFRP